MSLGSNYTGKNADSISIKQQELSFYLQAQSAFASGAQEYSIGNRRMQRMNPKELQQMIDKLMLEIVMLQGNGRRRSYAVILRDI